MTLKDLAITYICFKHYNTVRIFHFIAIFIVLNFSSFAQQEDKKQIKGNITLSSDDVDLSLDLTNNLILNDTLWKYILTDHSGWSNSELNDASWQSIDFPLDFESLDEINFKGIAWFRNTFSIDSSLINENLNLIVEQTGASEIYIDGILLQRFGKVAYLPNDENLRDPNNIPINIRFDKPGKHCIAIRYSNFYGLKYANHYDFSRSWLNVSLDKENEFKKKVGKKSLITIETIFIGILIGTFLILSLINLIFYLFYKKEKSNQFFSVFSFFMMLMFLLPFISEIYPNPKIYFLIDNAVLSSGIFSTIYLMRLIFYFVYTKTPIRFKTYVILYLITLLILFINYSIGKKLHIVLNIVVYGDLIINSLIVFLKNYDPEKRKRKNTLWVIIALAILAIIMLFIEPMISAMILVVILMSFILPIVGFTFVVPVYMIVKQAKNFASLNKELENKLIEVQELSQKTIEQEIEKQLLLENQNKLLEEQVKQRTYELSLKNQEITDSIHYASRIQQALLINKDEIVKNINNHFILFKPKDIVSGDFYFYAKHQDYIFLAAADCTGHGVPGSLMSMIGHEKLKLAVAHTINPGEILTYLNKSIKEALNQHAEKDSTRDGMDIALVRINFLTNEVVYSGANRPIWIIKKDKSEIEEIKATKKAIGGFTDSEQIFDEHYMSLNEGDVFYLFSDGYADQFGKNGKKLMTKKFKEILLSINSLNMLEQQNYLDNFIENWKSGIEQIDDILVIGVKF
jgi:serine phosphatase RsbU (regulator of sigma subunit)